MGFSTEQVAAIMSLPRFGNAKAIQLISLAAPQGRIENASLRGFINEAILSKSLKGLSGAALVSEMDVARALRKAEDMLSESESLLIRSHVWGSSGYPRRLANAINESGRHDPPAIAYVLGNQSLLSMPSVAAIGTRHATVEGVAAAVHIGKVLSSAGFNVVSGLALGCDAAAHLGALSAGGRTTAVMGGGLDKCYPSQNKQIFDQIRWRGGLLLSEQPVGSNPTKHSLVARDRLQAAISDAVIVVQTAPDGGSMHAARCALAAVKPVFCVKYRSLGIHPQTEGLRDLVGMGAKWLTSESLLPAVLDAIGRSAIPG